MRIAFEELTLFRIQRTTVSRNCWKEAYTSGERGAVGLLVHDAYSPVSARTVTISCSTYLEDVVLSQKGNDYGVKLESYSNLKLAILGAAR